MSLPSPNPRDWSHLVLLSFMWGTSFLFTRIALGTLPPVTVVAARLVLGAVVLLGLLRVAGHRLPRGTTIWVWYFVLGLLGNALPFTLITWGQERIDSGLAAILLAVMPLGTLVLAHLFVAGESMTRAKTAGFCIGFAGLVVLVGPDALRELGGGSSSIGRQLAVVAGALCYSANAIVARRLPPHAAVVNTAGSILMATLLMVPIALIVDRPWTLGASVEVAVALGWLGIVSTAVASVVYFRIIASAGPTFLALINYLIPLVAVVGGMVVLGEELPPHALVALAIILGGIGVSQRSR